jgi:hypothetical protein
MRLMQRLTLVLAVVFAMMVVSAEGGHIRINRKYRRMVAETNLRRMAEERRSKQDDLKIAAPAVAPAAATMTAADAAGSITNSAKMAMEARAWLATRAAQSGPVARDPKANGSDGLWE